MRSGVLVSFSLLNDFLLMYLGSQIMLLDSARDRLQITGHKGAAQCSRGEEQGIVLRLYTAPGWPDMQTMVPRARFCYVIVETRRGI